MWLLLTAFLCSGGKSGASTIETDHEWDVARAALMKKNKDTCGVSVEIDVDAMDGFRIRKRVCFISYTRVISDLVIFFQTHALADPNHHEDEELLYGTKVHSFPIFDGVTI